MDGLNESQRKAAEFSGKHLLVLAGAGTGKTRTIVARAAHLLRNGVQPHRIVILSFTRKSAREIAERLKMSVAGDVKKDAITGKTFHSWCNEIMHAHPELFPHSSFTPLDEDDRLSAMALAIGKDFRDGTNAKITKEAVTAIYSYAINTRCSLSDAIYRIRYADSDKDDKQVRRRIEDDKALIAPVIRRYIDFKKERRYIDYDDMLNVVADALERSAVVRSAVTGRYEHVLVDEMQDTNPLQYRLLRSFAERSHLFCVGDDAQSIYAFRGADFKAIHSFKDVIPDSETLRLELNYRSTQEILDLSNWLLEQSPLAYGKRLVAHRGDGERPNLIHIQDDWEEANVITDDIQRVVADGGKYQDTMVLGRSGWALSKVEGACLTKKIPYIKLGGTSLMQSAHVRDVVSAMRIATNIYDEIAWVRYLQLWDNIGSARAASILSQILLLDTFEKMMEELGRMRIKGMAEEIPMTLTNVRQFVNDPSRAMHEALTLMGRMLERRYKDEWSYRVTDFDVLQEVAKSTGSISEFIAEYILDPKAETTLKLGHKAEEDVVTLSTIHSAKGLEAKTVHVLSVNPFNYPNARSVKQGEDAIEEERRCLYVALTRAEDRLCLYRFSRSFRTQISDGGNKELSLYFLNNLPSELVNMVVNGQLRTDTPERVDPGHSEASFPEFDFE